MTKPLNRKPASESTTIITELVMPNDTNHYGKLFGGTLLSWMDRAAAIVVSKHGRCNTVTASVNQVSFKQPVALGSIVTIIANVTRVFNTSAEVFIEAWADNRKPNEKPYLVNEAIFNMVCFDEKNNKIRVPDVLPKTDIEKERYEGALRRRQLALVLAKKMKPSEATELKSLFEEE